MGGGGGGASRKRTGFPNLIHRASTLITQSRTQSNACARTRMALALGKLNFACAVIGLTFINRACRQRTGTPKFRGSGYQFPQNQCHPSPRTGIALGARLLITLRITAEALGTRLWLSSISMISSQN